MEHQAIPEGVEIRLTRTAPVKDIISLYRDAGWWEDAYDESPGFLEKIPRDSALFAGAFLNKKMIGMGRALSDLSSDAYIQDIAVLKSYQGRGIGRELVNQLLTRLSDLYMIDVICDKKVQPFYAYAGFQAIGAMARRNYGRQDCR